MNARSISWKWRSALCLLGMVSLGLDLETGNATDQGLTPTATDGCDLELELECLIHQIDYPPPTPYPFADSALPPTRAPEPATETGGVTTMLRGRFSCIDDAGAPFIFAPQQLPILARGLREWQRLELAASPTDGSLEASGDCRYRLSSGRDGDELDNVLLDIRLSASESAVLTHGGRLPPMRLELLVPRLDAEGSACSDQTPTHAERRLPAKWLNDPTAVGEEFVSCSLYPD